MLYVLTAFIIIGIIDLGGMIKSGESREFKVTLLVMIIAFILASLYTLQYRIPSPLIALDQFFSEVLGLSY